MKHFRLLLYPFLFLSLFFLYFYLYGNPFTQYSVKDSTIQKIIDETIDTSMSDYEKIKAIHDYIVVNTVYDQENLEKNSIPDIDYTAKGVFENGIAVCRGYAEAFQLLMEALDIECQIVTGYAENTTHAWNIVKLDGQWYHVDTTFDDPIDDTMEHPYDNLRYDYFLINDDQMFLDHIMESNAPACTSDLYMYGEKKYNTPYEVIKNAAEIPAFFTRYYNSGINSVTFYFPEQADLSSAGIINRIGTQLFSSGNHVTGCSYTAVTKCGDYYYTTITVN